MIAPWLAVALVTVAVVGLVILPLFRRPRPAPDRADYDLAIFREQLAEVERDLKRGLLGEQQAAAVRTEIQRRLLAVADAAGAVPRGASAEAPMARRRLAAAVAVVVAAGAVAAYLGLGAPGVPDMPLAERGGADHAGAASQADLASAVEKLAARLEIDPGNVDGWILLGRSYRTLDRSVDAALAFRRAVEASGRDPEIVSLYAESVVVVHGGAVSEEAKALFEEVRSRDPDDPRARYYLAAAKAQGGDARGALEDWRAMVVSAAPGAPWLPAVRAQIAETASALGLDPATVLPPAPTEERRPGREEMEAVAKMSPEDQATMIRSMVEGLAARLAENPDDRDGWLRLARAYEVLGEADKAREARARAEALRGR